MNEKIFEYYIWDKQTPIGISTAKDILERNPMFNIGDVFVVKVSGINAYIESVPAIRRKLQMVNSSTDEEVISTYMDNLINNREQEPEQVITWKAREKELAKAKLLLMEGESL